MEVEKIEQLIERLIKLTVIPNYPIIKDVKVEINKDMVWYTVFIYRNKIKEVFGFDARTSGNVKGNTFVDFFSHDSIDFNKVYNLSKEIERKIVSFTKKFGLNYRSVFDNDVVFELS